MWRRGVIKRTFTTVIAVLRDSGDLQLMTAVESLQNDKRTVFMITLATRKHFSSGSLTFWAVNQCVGSLIARLGIESLDTS